MLLRNLPIPGPYSRSSVAGIGVRVGGQFGTNMFVVGMAELVEERQGLLPRATGGGNILIAELDAHRLVAIEVKATAAPRVDSVRHLIWS